VFTNLLIHELQVFRRSGDVDRFGQPVDANPTFAGPATGSYPCRISSKSGNQSGGRDTDDYSQDVFEINYRVFVDPDADVREDDTVMVLDPRTSYELMPKALVTRKAVVSDGVAAHHLEIDCRVERGPQ
jgi:hypothetical protein